MFDWCDYSPGRRSHYFTFNNCSWHNMMYLRWLLWLCNSLIINAVIQCKTNWSKARSNCWSFFSPQLRQTSALNVFPDFNMQLWQAVFCMRSIIFPCYSFCFAFGPFYLERVSFSPLTAPTIIHLVTLIHLVNKYKRQVKHFLQSEVFKSL